MRLLHVIPSFAPAWRYGGPIYAALGLTRELVRQGHKVMVMTTSIDGPGDLDVPLERPVLMDGVEVWYFPIEYLRWYCFSRSLGRALQQQVNRFDLVHIHSIFLWPTTIAAFWCRRHKIPYLIRPAGSLDPVTLTKSYDRWWVRLSSRAKKWLYLKTLGKWDLKYASAIHFTSQAEMESAGPLKLRPPGIVVPLGIEAARPEETSSALPLCERYPQLKGKKIVLFLSRLDPKKGLELLAEALGNLARRRSDFAFVVAGSGTNAYEAKVTALVKRHGLHDRTIFLGHVQGKEKWSLFGEADVFVLPSYHENFGMAIGEAMAAGLPVIISKNVNIHREVRQAGAGLVIDLDPKEIASAVEQLLANDNLRLETGQKGARLVRERWTWDKVAKAMLQVYDEIRSGIPLVSANRLSGPEKKSYYGS